MESIIRQGPVIAEAHDTNTSASHAYFNTVKNWVAGQSCNINELNEKALAFGNASIAFRIMLKFLQSENAIVNLRERVFLTLINPVYKETGRLQTRDNHPHGENSLRTKIACINYFASLNPLFSGRVIVVDDGCPEGSGAMARSILSEYPDSEHAFYDLGRAIDEKDADLPPGLTHKDGANRSVKGGAVLYGMKKALKNQYDGLHIIVDNDADLSVHPMQLGLLVDKIVNEGVKAVAGSRREDDSVSLIGAGRNLRGTQFIKIWQHLLPQLAEQITDTNRAFKAFESRALEKILPSIQIYTFPYQIEILQACISMDVPLCKLGVAYIDSEAASTQSGPNITETYLNQIKQIIDIAQRYQTIPSGDSLLNYFLSITEEEWQKVNSIYPDNILDLVTFQ